MILIRGFDQERYARTIEQGIIGFRDILTTLLYHAKNGYKFSDYYEEYLIEAISAYDTQHIDFGKVPPELARQLQLIFDPFVPHFYVSYFHVLNEKSEEWLENFSAGSRFIFAVPKVSQIAEADEMLYGRNMLGSRMIYLPPDGKARTQRRLLQKVGVMAMVQHEIDASEPYGGTPFEESMYVTGVISSMCLELFARRCGGGFDESENEFRILYKKPTPFRTYSGCFEAVEPRNFRVTVDGISHTGRIIRNLQETPFSRRIGYNMALHANHLLARRACTTLLETVEENRDFSIESDFLSVNVGSIFNRYGYIGDAEECRRFIRENLEEEDKG